MANYRFGVRVPSLPGAYEPAALGVDANNKLTSKDLYKACKLAANNNYVLAANGDDLEAVVATVEAHTVNNGFSFGSVQVRFTELEVINKDAGVLVVGDAVICAAQAAIGTAQNSPHVKKGAGTLFKWRVKSLLTGAGAVDSTVLIEPITR